MVKNALIITGGPCANKEVLTHLPDIDLVIAADSGFDNALSLGITPDLVIGDLDSISASSLDLIEKHSIQLISYPQDKDKSDLELTLMHASKNCGSITILDSGSGRIDHLLGLFAAMTSEATAKLSCDAFVSTSYIKVVRDCYRVKPAANKLVSVFPFAGEAKGVCLSGFRWDLDNETISSGSTLGLSNEIVASFGEISLQDGILLVIQPDIF
ncbi:MAG: thiamine diphosphokinase [Acidimicrobiaceae bacterium]|jgi:thiamine pyrophosphokinase|nr:thiamine diphosphokinase [Acidimicrobiaceae bacterium]|tara:strand:+ start:77046 stop:77684 length:639 start_codon:yes stop_codon:yes gene_type:complete